MGLFLLMQKTDFLMTQVIQSRIKYNPDMVLKQMSMSLLDFNLYLTNGFAHHYQLNESTFILGVLGVIFVFYLIFR